MKDLLEEQESDFCPLAGLSLAERHLESWPAATRKLDGIGETQCVRIVKQNLDSISWDEGPDLERRYKLSPRRNPPRPIHAATHGRDQAHPQLSVPKVTDVSATAGKSPEDGGEL